jgi:transposase
MCYRPGSFRLSPWARTPRAQFFWTLVVSAPAPEAGKKFRQMTERERRKACELYARGDATREQLAKRYGVTTSAIDKMLASRGVTKGMKSDEVARKVSAALDQKTVDEVNETVERTRKTRDDSYRLFTAINTLAAQAINKARTEGRSLATTTGEMRALRFAAETAKLAMEGRFLALGIDPLEAKDADDLPDLRVTELTRDEIEQRRKELEAAASEEDGLDVEDLDAVMDLEASDEEPDPAATPADVASGLASALEGIETPVDAPGTPSGAETGPQ